MFRIYKSLFFLFLLILPISSHSHVEHYKNLNLIEFDIYRNNKHIGTHVFSFKKIGDQLAIESEINFKIV